MRGFPLLNFLLVLLALAGFGMTLRHLAAPPAPAPIAAATTSARDSSERVLPARVELILSKPASRLRLTTADGTLLLDSTPDSLVLVGDIELPHHATGLALQVDWHHAPAGHHFAKLTLEPQGRETLEHIFDGRGNLDELWEFPRP
jgi:hypothetical protein